MTDMLSYLDLGSNGECPIDSIYYLLAYTPHTHAQKHIETYMHTSTHTNTQEHSHS